MPTVSPPISADSLEPILQQILHEARDLLDDNTDD